MQKIYLMTFPIVVNTRQIIGFWHFFLKSLSVILNVYTKIGFLDGINYSVKFAKFARNHFPEAAQLIG
jgi:hypothetical protein